TALAAALLAERDPFTRSVEREKMSNGPPSSSDVLDRVEALEQFERTGRTEFSCGHLHRGSARFVLRARDQLNRLAGQEMRSDREPASAGDEGLLRSLLAAFPDPVVR